MDDARFEAYLNEPLPLPLPVTRNLVDQRHHTQMNEPRRYPTHSEPRYTAHFPHANNGSDDSSMDSSIERSRIQHVPRRIDVDSNSYEERNHDKQMTSVEPRGGLNVSTSDRMNMNAMPPPNTVIRKDQRVNNRGSVHQLAGKSHVNPPPLLATTFFHVAEIPTRKLPEEKDFYLSLLAMPNATDDQVNKKKKSIENYKMKANRWGRDYLQNEYVNITNLIAASYGIEKVQHFRDIKRRFSSMDCTNQKNLEAMKEIQYFQWLPPHMRSMWKTGMEATFMTEFNYVYKLKTMEEDNLYKFGCFAKLFAQIKVDLNKQLQECGTRTNISDSMDVERIYVKRRSNKGTSKSSNKRPYVQVAQMSVSENISDMTSGSDLVKAENKINLLQQQLNDMKRLLNNSANSGVSTTQNVVSIFTKLQGHEF
jgi:hypothetical protein